MSTTRKSVAFLFGNMALGGTESKIIKLANRLSKQNFDVHILVIGRPYTLKEKISEDIFVRCFNRRAKFSPLIWWKVRRYIYSCNIESVVCVNLYPLVYGWLAGKGITGESKKCIGLVNTSEFVTSRDALFMKLYGAILRRCDKVIFGCKSQASEWTEKYRIPRHISTVIYNGVDRSHFSRSQVSGEFVRTELNLGDQTSVIGCVAQLRPEKGHSILLRSFEQLVKHHGLDVMLVIVGEGAEKHRLTRIVSSKGLSDRVRFVGQVDDVRPYLAVFDVFVMPSIGVEVFSNAMLEAISMNVAIVSSDVGGSSEMIEHERDGLIYPRNDSNLLTEYIVRLVKDKKLGHRLRASALHKLEQEFTLEKMDNDYIESIWQSSMSR